MWSYTDQQVFRCYGVNFDEWFQRSSPLYRFQFLSKSSRYTAFLFFFPFLGKLTIAWRRTRVDDAPNGIMVRWWNFVIPWLSTRKRINYHAACFDRSAVSLSIFEFFIHFSICIYIWKFFPTPFPSFPSFSHSRRIRFDFQTLTHSILLN